MKRLLVFSLFLVSVSYAQPPSLSSFGLTVPKITNCTPVKDQYMSSTCWSFSSMSFIESELLKKGRGMHDLSEMFIARHSMMRKIERHLKLKGGNFFTPGGQFHDVVWVMKNYGMMPEEAYNGKGRGEIKHNHAEMDTLLNSFVAACIKEGITELTLGLRQFTDSVMDSYYGKLPGSFLYKGKMYTPQTYLINYLDINPEDFVEITSYTHHPFYKSFVLEDKYNWTGDAYYNVTISDFSRITDSALKKGYTVGWDGDADDPDFHFFDGLAFLSKNTGNYQQERQTAFESQSTLLDHMMHIVAITKDRQGKKWYYIKNSWGDYLNSLGGFLFMREDYFKIRTLAIIVNKNAIPADIRMRMRL